MKTCSICRVEQPRSNFGRNAAAKDGLFAWCKPCQREYNRKYYASGRRKRDPEKVRAQRSAYYDRNREKIAAYKREYGKRNREAIARQVRDWNLRKKYGLTTAEWDALFESQGRACAGCGSGEPQGRYWHTDHCHTTGRVRGILCHHCNMAVGHVKDSPEILMRLRDYLAR